jgi:putative transposase
VDTVFIERLWCSVKYEEVHLRDYADLHELERALDKWFGDYNHWRPHQTLEGQRPWEVYRLQKAGKAAA